jgi:hypothetical protein
MNKITPKQRDFILRLLDEKDLSNVEEGRLDSLYKSLRISEDPEEFGMSTRQASEVIEWLLRRPKQATEQAAPLNAELPAGRYAIENEQGELRFYQLWVSKDGKRRNLYVLFGPSEAKLYPKTQEAICQKILDVGYRECAIRFGNEIGMCSNCGRRLTNRISRELGIGPICGGRMFNGDWAAEVAEARQRLFDRGEDPDEDLDEQTIKAQIQKLEWLKEQMAKGQVQI